MAKILQIDDATKSIELEDGARNGYEVSTFKDAVPNVFRKAFLTTDGYRLVSHCLAPGKLVRYYTSSQVR